MPKAYAIMSIGKKIEMSIGHSESPRSSDLRGLSLPFWVGGLGPRLATSFYPRPTICRYSS